MYLKEGLDEALKIVNAPETNDETLQKILKEFHGDIEVAEAVARHPNIHFVIYLAFYHYLPGQAKLNPSRDNYSQLPEWSDRLANFQSSLEYVLRRSSVVDWLVNLGSCYVDEKRPEIFKINYYLEHAKPKVIAGILELENLPPSLIVKCTSHNNVHIRKALAKRKTVPEGTFEALAKDKTKTVRQTLAESEHAPAAIIAQLANDKESGVAKAALLNPNCPKEVIQQDKLEKAAQPTLADKSLDKLSEKELVDLACDPFTTKEKLKEVSAHGDPCIRYLCGLHANTSSEILKKLSEDTVNWVRESVAFNAKAPGEILGRLLATDSKHMQIALASNINLPEKMQLMLSEIGGDEVRKILADTTSSEAVWKKILDTRDLDKKKHHGWETDLEKALSDKVTTGNLLGLQRGYKSRHLFISKIAARSEKCPPSLIGHYAYYIFDELAKNPTIALKLLENPNAVKAEKYADWKVEQWLTDGDAPGHVSNYYLKSDDEKRRVKATKNWSALLSNIQMLVFENDIRARKQIAARDRLTRFMLEILSRDEKPSVREIIAKNNICPPDILERLANDKANVVSTAALFTAKKKKLSFNIKPDVKNKGPKKDRVKMAKESSSSDILMQLSGDRDKDVRNEVAKNEKTPAKALKSLANDENATTRKMVAHHSNTNKSVVETLLNDKNEGVRYAAAHHSCWITSEKVGKDDYIYHYDSSILDKMKNDTYDHIRAIVARYTEDHELQQHYLKDSSACVRESLATNPYLEKDIVYGLLKDESDKIRKETAKAITGIELFFELADYNDKDIIDGLSNNSLLNKREVQQKLVNHPNVDLRSKAVLYIDDSDISTMEAYSLDTDSTVKSNLAYKDKLPKIIISNLLSEINIEVVKALDYNNHLNKKQIEKIIQQGKIYKTYFAQSIKDASIIEILLDDKDAEVRMALLDNYYLSSEQKKRLLNDCDKRIVEKAKLYLGE